jgi:hypothetical protein
VGNRPLWRVDADMKAPTPCRLGSVNQVDTDPTINY